MSKFRLIAFCFLVSLVATSCSFSSHLAPNILHSINYSGQYHWHSQTKTLTFLSSGSLNSGHQGWDIPKQIKTLKIAKNVKVQGRFNVFHSLEIKGQNAVTSLIYGTPIKRYNKLNNGCGLCKSAILARGEIQVKITNLTSLDPYGFHFTGKDGAQLIIDGVRAIDARGGHQNNSDGVSAASGTIIRNSYFETADDVIKVYADITVENTMIKMIGNTVPIQFGWGSYGNNATAVFNNVTIIGEAGRNNTGNAVIDARKGRYTKNLILDKVTIINLNSALINFWNEGQQAPAGTANIVINNSTIEVNKFAYLKNMQANVKVCNQMVPLDTTQTSWSCGQSNLASME
ncbi:hypothetical protein [Catenovulum adriaticum]|uniref:Glycoside hydrolase family 28 protein n=1 Tax=Catenovulum adriaticum TaxID=2984846 RepID=A0ABY7AR57_9ALTE|nr:hypothetical protein [Catenovulum sp. TS8]WAJ71805.1 glycoside hydrolase family 28 protein [Catenovulum sp. TS8]